MAFNPAQWESLPINDDTLYGLLHAANNPSLTLDPTRFPAPAVDNPTPPASEESSPSPPSIKERESFSAGRNARRPTIPYDDDHPKRKQDDITDSDDSSYEQPSKYQHRPGELGANGPRRSASGTKKKSGSTDERAQKRKEQNRAAQRAFRERKERHVKELEDQVAALEAKSANQDRENENLRDLLGRLQNENLLLKQSAFTFSFPSGNSSNPSPSTSAPASDAARNSTSGNAPRRAPSPKLSSPSSSSSASTPEKTTGEIPESSLFARPNSSRPSLHSGASTSSGSSPRSEATTSRFQSSPSAFGLGSNLPENNFNNNGLDFLGGNGGQDLNLLGGGNAKTQVNGYTTIAANPMYMSFGDPVLDPMAWASFGPGDYAAVSSTTPPSLGNPSAELDIYGLPTFSNSSAINLMSGGGGAPGSNGSVNGAGAGMYTMDDLFGASNGASNVTPSFLDASSSSSMTGSHSTASSSTGGATFSSATSTSSALPADHVHSEDTCPKTPADVRRRQEGVAAQTFGPPVSVPSPPAVAAVPKPMSPPASLPAHVNNSQVQQPLKETSEACAHARMAALCADLPRTTKKPNQIEIGRAWEKIRQQQGFEECDIDELCNELSAKARCDGSRPVLEEASFNSIVQGLGMMHKQRSNSGASAMGPPMPQAVQS